MISELTLPKHKVDEVAQDYQALYDIGLQHVQNLAQRIWTDYNVHDPGITTLELLCYALTDLSYRASFPIEDLLASEKDNAKEMEKQFFTARQILPNRPLTVADYRKLLIDLPGVKNAWLHLAIKTYYANMEKRELQWQNDSLPDTMPVKVVGLYDVLIEFMDNISSTIKDDTMKEVRRLLQANRNLCEDFVNISEVGTPQSFLLCAELELTPIADEAKVKAEILFQVQQYLAPPVDRYTLSEMLERKQADGTRYTADKIFEGPALYGGFIDDDELAKANLREEIRLSDIISIIMDVEGVQAVRDIVISPQNSPQGTQTLLENKWVVPVAPGQKAWIDEEGPSRLVFYKRNMRVEPNDDKVLAYYKQLTKAAKTEAETGAVYDFDIPLGKYRQPGSYYSFQNHFPVVYGLSEEGLSSAADDKRKALAYQLKAYLLFLDQVMANYLSQLSHLKDLFSTDPELECVYFYQMVDTFTDYDKIYNSLPKDNRVFIDRRNRFLDHLIARFAEKFNDYAHTMYAIYGSNSENMIKLKSENMPENMIKLKCKFLKSYPAISSERALAYNYSPKDDADLWDTENISGLEKRLAKLLGINNFKRRNLNDSDEEGMYLIENILLRPESEQSGDPFLPIGVDPSCTDCPELDPYSYRIHVILPAYAGRFSNMEFRRFAEEVIREETPAHILPKICWISEKDMAKLEKVYYHWVYLKAGVLTENRTTKLTDFTGILYALKNNYPVGKLHAYEFILGQTAIGTSRS